jgi:hypothetical protein
VKRPPKGAIGLDPRWSASRIADEILSSYKKDNPLLDMDALQAAMDEIWGDARVHLTQQEGESVDQVRHLALPNGDLRASISAARSGQGYFIIFDSMLEIKLNEIFTAPRNSATWASAYLSAAFGQTYTVANWVEPEISKLEKGMSDGLPDSYSIMAARQFIYAHEWGHLLLGHIKSAKQSTRQFAGVWTQMFDPGLQDELDADAFACALLSRPHQRTLSHPEEPSKGLMPQVQQMGVDWLFGFLGAVLGIRKRVKGRQWGRHNRPILTPAMSKRRESTWQDYGQRCANSPLTDDHGRENELTVIRVRASVDNFNSVVAPKLVDAYLENPKALMDWQRRVADASPDTIDWEPYTEELAKLLGQAGVDPYPL